jgi:hypothetical protein
MSSCYPEETIYLYGEKNRREEKWAFYFSDCTIWLGGYHQKDSQFAGWAVDRFFSPK